MDEHTSSRLRYGHPGTAEYDTISRQWNFLRNPHTSPLEPVGEPETIIPSMLDERPEKAIGPSAQLDKKKNKLDPGESLQTGTGFTIGNAVDARSRSSKQRVIAIAAHVAGEGASDVRLIPIKQGDFELPELNTRVKNPTIRNDDVGWWVGTGVPVQQICFSDPLEGNGLHMAIRQPMTITILRPQYHQTPKRAAFVDKKVNRSLYPASPLAANPTVTLTASQAKCSEFADIMFNPWYERQFAVVDVDGFWSVWDVEGISKTKLVDGPSGHLQAVMRHSNSSKSQHQEKWAAVCWAGGVDQLLVCDRKTLTMFETSASDHIWNSDLGLENSEIILQIRLSPANSSQVFLLTNVRVLWLEITNERIQNGKNFHVRASWDHFRSNIDESLNMNALICGTDLHVLIYSQRDNIVQGFPLSYSKTETIPKFSVKDPYLLRKHRAADGKSVESLRSLEIREIDFAKNDLPSRLDDGLFFKSFELRKDLGLFEAHYIHAALNEATAQLNEQDGGDDEKRKNRHKILIPANIYRKKRSALTPRFASAIDFVAEEGEDVAETNQSRQRPSETKDDLDGSSIRKRAKDAAHDFEGIYGHISRPITFAQLSVEDGGVPHYFESLCRRVREASETDHPFMRTLSDIRKLRPKIQDIEEDSDLFSTTVNSLIGRGQEGEAQLAYTLSSSTPNLADVYDSLLSTWIGALPESIPGRTRTHKDKTVLRPLSLELCMAQVMIPRTIDREIPVQRRSRVEVDDGYLSSYTSDGDYRLSSARTTRESSPMMQVLSSSQATDVEENTRPLGTAISGFPTPEQTPSLRSASSFASLAGTDDGSNGLYSSLRAYTTVSLPPTHPRSRLSRVTKDILSHWDLGTDPNQYNYTAKEDFLEEEHAEDRDQRRAKREKIRKSRQRQENKRSRSAASSNVHSRATSVASSQPIMVESPASLPIASSQVTITGLPGRPLKFPSSSQVHPLSQAGHVFGSSSQLDSSAPLLDSFSQIQKRSKKAKKRAAGF